MRKKVNGLTSNVCDEDIIKHHIPESPGVSLGSQPLKQGRIDCLSRLLERALLLVNGGVFVEHVCKLIFQLLS